MRGFVRFTKVLVMLLIIAAIIGSTPYVSFSEIPFNLACQFLKNATLPGIGKSTGTNESCVVGEKSVMENFAQDSSEMKVQDKPESRKGSFESSGEFNHTGDYHNYIGQNTYLPQDIYSNHSAQQYFGVKAVGGAYASNVEEKSRSSGKEELFLTINEIKTLRNMGMADKLKAMTIFSKIDGSSIEKICTIAEGGITYDEVEEIKLLLRKNLASNHIEELNDIIIRNKKLLSQNRLSAK